MENIVLSNGIRCLIYPMTNTHSITVGLYIKAGAAYGESKCGITHLLEHLHFRQLGEISQSQLYYRMEKIGSTLRATTYRDFMQFSMKVAPCYIGECVQIFADLINAKDWSEESFYNEVQVVLNQIAEGGAYTSIESEVRQCIFEEHPLSSDIMGSVEQIDKISIEDIISYKNMVFNASSVLICLTGNFTDNQQTEMIKVLSECIISPQRQEVQLTYPKGFHKRKPNIMFVYEDSGGQLDVNISFDVNYKNADVDYLTILNCILGEGVGSKLQKRIREEKCYSSNIASYIEWYSGFAVLQIRFSVEKKLIYQCLDEVLNVIKSLKVNITEKDLDTALPFYTTNQVFYEDDTEGMNYQLGYHHLIFSREFKAMCIPNDRESARTIQALARDLFSIRNCCIVVMGNTKRLTKRQIAHAIEKI